MTEKFEPTMSEQKLEPTKKRVWFSAPVFDDEEKSRSAFLLNFITIANFIAASVVILLALAASNQENFQQTVISSLQQGVPTFLIVILAQVLLRSGRVKVASISFGILLFLNQTYSLYSQGGTASYSLFNYILTIMVFGLLLDRRYAIASAFITIAAAFTLLSLGNQGLLPEVASADNPATVGLFTFLYTIFLTTALLYLYLEQLNAFLLRSREVSLMLEKSNALLEQSNDVLEARVQERTRNLELAAAVGREVSQVRNLNVMLKDACELILREFDLYYVQVYLTDRSGSTLKLEAGTGSVGEQLLGRSHSLPLNSSSINGRAAAEKHAVVIADTAQSSTFLPNPLLPDTRGEMAVPLIVADRVVGVLDMQSSQPGVLTEEVLPAFEALAGQLAVAIQNANLLAEAEQARAQVEAQARRLVREGWSEHLDAIHKPEQLGFVFAQNKVAPLAESEEAQIPDEEKSISAPIAVTGEPLGSLVVEIEDETRREQTSELVSIVARQVAQQIENLRLLESAERYRAEAEQASRRAIRENWKTYADAAGELGYVYDLKEVRPHNGGYPIEDVSVDLPLKVRDERVGKLSVFGLKSDDQEAIGLINDVAERLGAHIESLRQFDQTQTALAQSEKLFEASSQLAQATDLQKLVDTVVNAINIPVINRALLLTFSYNSNGDLDGMDVIGNWWNGNGHEATPVGTHYTPEIIRLMPMFKSPVPIFFNDSFNDERVDATTMQLVKRLNLRAVAALPLHSGTHQIGMLMLESEEPYNFTQSEIRLYTALAPQIATVLENRRQFAKAQQQAERESKLNVISQKIQSATTVEAVLQIAARELGHALGAPMTVAQLSMKDKQ